MNRDAVNAINVYPVPDGDTGTNMLLTWRAAMKGGPQDASAVGEYMRGVARGALLGARGNSGVILSQMLRGLAEELAESERADCASLCRALLSASRVAYEAVTQPVEGTMLTVMREGAAAAADEGTRCDEVPRVLAAFVAEARASVERTPDLLPRLRDAGVVDAGGLGVAVLFEGVHLGLAGEPLPEPMTAETTVELSGVEHEGHGYCTEFVVLGQGLDRGALEGRLAENGGDSILVVGDPDAVHVHVHTPDPGMALTAGVAFGSLASVKVENMQAQHEEWAAGHEAIGRGGEERPLPAVGMVAVARGDGIVAAFRDLGATRVLDGGPTGKASAGELLEAAREAGREHAILLPNDKDVLMAAEQAAQESEGFVTVIPTRSIAAGLAAAVAYMPEGDPEEVAGQMREAAEDVHCIEVTRSVRDATVDGVTVREGEAIAFLDGRLVTGGGSLEEALRTALEQAVEEGSSLATVYLGRDAEADAGARVTALIEEAFEELEVEVVQGGQPHYPYIVGIE
jgi:uncharacterized protein